MRGDKIIASVPKGQQVVVVEVRDPWLGIYVWIGDQKKRVGCGPPLSSPPAAAINRVT